jgi:putative ABC transport system permease protein
VSLRRRLLNMLPGRRRAVEADVREELDALRSMAEPGELGNLTLAAEDARAEWGWPLPERIARDLKMAFRTLRNNPGYSLACILILAVCIGANTAIFSVVYASELKPLPYPDLSRLVFVWEKISSMPEPVGPRVEVPRIVYQQWQRQRALFDDVAAFKEAPLNEAGVARPRTLSTGFASANLFGLLGARAAAGRLFRADEEQKGRDRVAVLSDTYFEKRFHRDPAAIGQSIALGREDYTVIGVLPPRFELPFLLQGVEQKKPEIWLPLSRLWNRADDDTAFSLFVMARLHRGVSLDHARAAVNALQDRLHKSDEARYFASQTSMFPVTVEDHFADADLALYVLLGAVGILLLIGCANLANLTMARAVRRAREVAIRRALGASRGRIIAQLLTESSLLSIAGAGRESCWRRRWCRACCVLILR